MKLEALLKTALDEVRMQMLGAQVLFGFQLQGVFQDRFSSLSPLARRTDFAALVMIVATFGLLVAVPSQHRFIERGEATMRILEVTKNFAALALLPLAVALACDVYVVGEIHLGHVAALTAAAGTGLVALAAWYGFGMIAPGGFSSKEKLMPAIEEAGTPLHAKIEQMLTEARVILPGVQALLGFQFVVTMTAAFAALPQSERLIHFGALTSIILCVILLIMPAAVHRLSFDGRDDIRFHRIGSALVTLALVPLMVGVAADFYVAAKRMLGSEPISTASAVLIFLFLATLWFAVPLALRVRREKRT